MRVGSEKNGQYNYNDIHILYMCTHLYGQWTMFSCSTMHSQVHLIISQKEKLNYVIELSSDRKCQTMRVKSDSSPCR